ncbi:hypothetical protein NKH81_32800, partial [Mesorhizobium sp. M0959]|uniref:hypothetical protein n=1 Tax=Mesorhizobium sp. M0959 TaxID=2957034 RepID=UPI00333CE420
FLEPEQLHPQAQANVRMALTRNPLHSSAALGIDNGIPVTPAPDLTPKRTQITSAQAQLCAVAGMLRNHTKHEVHDGFDEDSLLLTKPLACRRALT